MRDAASGPTQQAERNVQRSIKATERTYTDASRVEITSSRALYTLRAGESTRSEQQIQRNVVQTEAAYVRSNRNVLMGSQRLAEARSVLDVRSEQTVQREINQTIAAYNRLQRAGFASANEQARAFVALQKKVADLNKELGKTVEKQGLLSRGVSGVHHIGEGIAGAYAGSRVIAGPVDRTMQFDMRMALMANTAYRNLTPKERVKKTEELRHAIYRAVGEGGGTLEQAEEALEKLLSHDVFGHKAAFELLPRLQKGAMAEGADSVELGNIAARSVQSMRIPEKDAGIVTDMAAAGGHTGEFKIRDLARYLPEQMAAAANAGFSGPKGIATIIAMNEAAMTTAGTTGQAGTNVQDLLHHLSSTDLAHRAKRAGIANFDEVKIKTQERGGNMLDAVEAMTQTILGKNPKYQEVQRKLKTASPGERKELLTDMSNLIQGSAIGKLFGNQQAVMALTAYMTQKDKYREAYNASMKEWDRGGGMIASDFEVVKGMDGFKAQQLKNEAEIAEMEALRGLNEKLGDAAGKLADYAKEYPGLAKAIAGTTLAFEGLTGVLTGIGLMRLVTGGGAAAAGAGAGVAAEAGLFARGAGLARWAGPVGAIVAGVAEAASVYNDPSKTADEKKAGYVGAAGAGLGTWAGISAGAAAGAAIGSIVPGIGTAVGGVVGGFAGGYLGGDWGDKLGKTIGEAIFAQKKDEKPPVIENHVVFHVDAHNFQEFIAMSSQRTAFRY
ncbi:phage tail tape measure protein [Pandoraea sp. SD6-2]|uniref:phage tail tape measure protein n=1 Tax=Pandoraea sp. SD6-2 TaxID=1286093 RepID=UPI001FF075A7|nr:phage tail tape measure protein [Pandoraea sp. SD6-2]